MEHILLVAFIGLLSLAYIVHIAVLGRKRGLCQRAPWALFAVLMTSSTSVVLGVLFTLLKSSLAISSGFFLLSLLFLGFCGLKQKFLVVQACLLAASAVLWLRYAYCAVLVANVATSVLLIGCGAGDVIGPVFGLCIALVVPLVLHINSLRVDDEGVSVAALAAGVFGVHYVRWLLAIRVHGGPRLAREFGTFDEFRICFAEENFQLAIRPYLDGMHDRLAFIMEYRALIASPISPQSVRRLYEHWVLSGPLAADLPQPILKRLATAYLGNSLSVDALVVVYYRALAIIYEDSYVRMVHAYQSKFGRPREHPDCASVSTIEVEGSEVTVAFTSASQI